MAGDSGAERPGRPVRLGPVWPAFVILLVLFTPDTGKAQSLRQDLAAGAAEVANFLAPVEIDGIALFVVRGGTVDSARERARTVAERIEGLAQDSAFSTDSLRVFDLRDQTNILADKDLVMSVYDMDSQPEGVTRMALAGAFKDTIAQAVQLYREERTQPILLRKSAYAGVATLGLIVGLIVLGWAFRRLVAILDRRYKGRMKDVQIQSFHILEAEDLWSALRGAIGTVHVLLVVAALIAYLDYVLGLYPWTRPFGLHFLRLVLRPLETIGAATLTALPNLIFILILFLIVRYLLKMTRLFFGAVALGRVKLAGFEREWALPTYKIVRLFAVAFAVVVAYPYIPGSGSDAFKGVTIFFGLVLSLGSTSIIGNLIAGYTMTYRRAFRVGDRIKVKDSIGDVVEMRLLETHLRSLKNEEVVIPNTVILSNQVVNYSTLAKDRGLILHTGVGVGYEVPWRQVEAMLTLAAERTPGFLRDPAPFVLKTALEDFCVHYELNVYADDPSPMPELYSKLHENILDVFNEHGVQIMTPAYVGDPDHPKVVAQERWFAPPAEQPPS